MLKVNLNKYHIKNSVAPILGKKHWRYNNILGE